MTSFGSTLETKTQDPGVPPSSALTLKRRRHFRRTIMTYDRFESINRQIAHQDDGIIIMTLLFGVLYM